MAKSAPMERESVAIESVLAKQQAAAEAVTKRAEQAVRNMAKQQESMERRHVVLSSNGRNFPQDAGRDVWKGGNGAQSSGYGGKPRDNNYGNHKAKQNQRKHRGKGRCWEIMRPRRSTLGDESTLGDGTAYLDRPLESLNLVDVSTWDMVVPELSGECAIEVCCGDAVVTLGLVMAKVPCIMPWDTKYGESFDVLKNGWILLKLVVETRVV